MVPEHPTEHAPWKQRFQIPTFANLHIARTDSLRGVIASNQAGTYQIFGWSGTSSTPCQITDHVNGVSTGILSADGQFVYYLQGQRNERGHYMRIPFNGGVPHDLTPDFPPYEALNLAISGNGSVIAFDYADEQGYWLYGIWTAPDGTTLPPRPLYQHTDFFYDPTLSVTGDLAVVSQSRSKPSLEYGLVAIDTRVGTVVNDVWDGAENSLAPVCFSPLPNDERLLAWTNRSGMQRPLLWHIRSGKRVDIALNDLTGDITPLDWSPDGTRLLLCQFAHATQRLYIYNLITERLEPFHHPSGTYEGAAFSTNETIVALWQDSTHPPEVVALDLNRPDAVPRTLLTPGPVPLGHAWRSVSFASTDGQPIQGWLGVPDGDGPFPTILHVHGGPDMAMMDSFSPESQAWLDHGFAYLTINYRGSVSFGRNFESYIWQRLGYWEVEDMVAAQRWLVQQGITHPSQIFVSGRSYGGYLTLLAVGKYPHLWAGGLAMSAIADWTIQYQDSSDLLRGYQETLFGGTPEEHPERYAESSPLTYVAQVQAPVLVIQGRNDMMCAARAMEEYERQILALGKTIEVQWFDAGHKVLVTEQRIAHQSLMLRFAQRIIRQSFIHPAH